MKFEALSLRSFRCYERSEVTFEPGVTVIHGANGSGKSTLLDACFFALYGSEALTGTLDEVITTGAEETAVSLTMTHDGGRYEVHREVRLRGDRAQTVTCELATPDGTITGARDVREEITALLRMDVDAFLNCAYVRQGEVNKLIHASPSERQDMIDELLQLGVLETYRDRATQARRGVASLLDEYGGQLQAIEQQIERKEERDLPATLNELETRRDAVEQELSDLADQIEEAETTKAEAEDVISQYEERREAAEELAEEIDELQSTIAETAAEREACAEEIGELTDEREGLQERLREARQAIDADGDPAAHREALEAKDEELRDEIESTRLALQRHEQRADQAESAAEEYREQATELASELEERREQVDADETALEERRAALAELEDERSELASSLEAAGFDDGDDVAAAVEEQAETVTTLRERESELRSRIDSLREEIAEMEELVEAGKCPTCGQPVMGAPAVESLDERRAELEALEEEHADVVTDREAAESSRDRLAELEEQAEQLSRIDERIATTAELVDERADRLAERRATVESLESERDELREAAAEADERAAAAREEADTHRETIADLNRQREELRTSIERVDTVLDLEAEREELADEIEALRERRANLESLNDERRERLAEKRDRRAELEAAVDPERLEEAREARDRAESYLERAADERASLQEERDDTIDRIGAVQNELQTLRELEEERTELRGTCAALEALHEDVEELESLYGDLRGDLRERNVRALEGMLNETFELVYQNDAYDRIELDREYRITVVQKDGAELDPSMLSGGERALFNLSLRCAIYRLLAEGIEGTAPLPPLILDEPTVYLDAGHVSQLVELVEGMRSLGVEQILLVTHDDELLRAADVVLEVEKDPTTNRSAVEATPAGPPVSAQD